MVAFSTFLLTLIPLSLSSKFQICDKDPCNFNIKQGETLVCGCNVNNCNIDITNTNGKMLNILTYAKSTKIVCEDKDSCQGATIRGNDDTFTLGNNNNVVTTSGLNCVNKKLEILCNNEASCKDMNISTIDVNTKVIALEFNSFNEGMINCFGEGNECKLKCDNKIESCNEALCNYNCKCVGKMCPGWESIPVKPEIEIAVPEPTPIVNYLKCTDKTVNGICTLEPKEGEKIVVPLSDNVNILKIDCMKKQQCKNIEVISSANTTIIDCGKSYQPCYGASIDIGNIPKDKIPFGYNINDFKINKNYNTVRMNCDGEDSCKNVNISITGKFNINPKIKAMGSSSFSDSCLICNIIGLNKCKLMCNVKEIQSCHDTQCKGDCIKSSETMKINSINVVNNGESKHEKSGEMLKYSLTAMEIIIIFGSIFGLICVIIYCVVFRYYVNKKDNESNMTDLVNHDQYNTFQQQRATATMTSLEMNQI